MLIVESQLYQEAEQHQDIGWNRQVKNSVQQSWVLFDSFKCWAYTLAEHKSYNEAFNDLEEAVAENLVERDVIVAAQSFVKDDEVI